VENTIITPWRILLSSQRNGNRYYRSMEITIITPWKTLLSSQRKPKNRHIKTQLASKRKRYSKNRKTHSPNKYKAIVTQKEQREKEKGNHKEEGEDTHTHYGWEIQNDRVSRIEKTLEKKRNNTVDNGSMVTHERVQNYHKKK
jgi:hypothetical protein